jgi:hypothetical protein
MELRLVFWAAGWKLCHDPSATARKGGGPSVGMTSDASVFSPFLRSN